MPKRLSHQRYETIAPLRKSIRLIAISTAFRRPRSLDRLQRANNGSDSPPPTRTVMRSILTSMMPLLWRARCRPSRLVALRNNVGVVSAALVARRPALPDVT